MWHHHWENIGVFTVFWLKILPQLNIKAVHDLKT